MHEEVEEKELRVIFRIELSHLHLKSKRIRWTQVKMNETEDDVDKGTRSKIQEMITWIWNI